MAIIKDYDILQSQNMSISEINFDTMTVPPISSYLSPMDIGELNRIATSASLNGKVKEKYRLIDAIMQNRGFKRFSAGTNRVIYKCTTDDRFIAKIAMDRVALNDNPAEFKNQFLLKPFVAKTFEVTPCGTVAFSEKVFPIKNEEEFKEVAGDIYEVIVNKILGEYIMEDIGSKYFMNWGIRLGFGPVLLDYPYLYKLDHNKLYCTKPTETGECCDGEIDYDKGFNHLVCYKCGKIYPASEVGQINQKNIKLVRGENTMKITLMYGNKVIASNYETTSTMKKPEPKIEKETNESMKPELIRIPINNSSTNNGTSATQNGNSTAVSARDVVLNAMNNIIKRNTPVQNNVTNYSDSAEFNAAMDDYKNKASNVITNDDGKEISIKSQEVVLNEMDRIKKSKLNNKFNNNNQNSYTKENKIPTFEDIAKYFDPANAAEGYQLKLLEIIYKNKGDIVATIAKIKQLFNFKYKDENVNEDEEVEKIKQLAEESKSDESTDEDVTDNNTFEIASSDENKETEDNTNSDVIESVDVDEVSDDSEESEEVSEDEEYDNDEISEEDTEEDNKDDESEDTNMSYSNTNGNIVTRDDLDHRDDLNDYDNEFEEYENIPKYRIKSGTGKHIKKFRPNEEEGD